MRSYVLFAVTVFCAFFGRGLALAAVGCVNGAPYGQAALMWICNALLED